MNRSTEAEMTEFFVHHSVTAMSPAQPMWVTIPYWRDDINDVDFERHPVVAIRSIIEYVYEGAVSNEIAPHYSELVKKGWTFLRTEISNDVLYCNLFDYRIRASADLVEVGVSHAIHTGERTGAGANAASKVVCDEFRARRNQIDAKGPDVSGVVPDDQLSRRRLHLTEDA